MAICEIVIDADNETMSPPNHAFHQDVDTRLPSQLIQCESHQNHDNKTPLNSNPPILPERTASLVSLATRSTGFAIRLGSALGGIWLDLAKVTTLTGLELCRGVFEDSLYRGHEEATRPTDSEEKKMNIETSLQGAINNMHTILDHAVFWTATGFNFTSATLITFSDASQNLLLILDKFLGSTDTSRALASVKTMIIRELENPAIGGHKEGTTATELAVAACVLAYLRRSCRGLLDQESLRFRVDEVVWDMVVLDDGTRLDLPTHDSPHNNDAHGLPTRALEREIMRCLPNNAKASIERDIATSEIVRVKVFGDVQQIRLNPPPPGVELVEIKNGTCKEPQGNDGETAYSQFVFRQDHRETRTTLLQKTEGHIAALADDVAGSDRRPGSDSPPEPSPVSDDLIEVRASLPGHTFSQLPISTPPLVQESHDFVLHNDGVTVNKPLPPTPVETLPDTPSSSSSDSLGIEHDGHTVPASAHREGLPGVPKLPRPPEKRDGLLVALKRSIFGFNKDGLSGHARVGKRKRIARTDVATRPRPEEQHPAAVANEWRPLSPGSILPMGPKGVPEGTGNRRNSTSGMSYISIHETVRHSSTTLAQASTTVPADDCLPGPVPYNSTTLRPGLVEWDTQVDRGRSHEGTVRDQRRRKSQALSIYTLATTQSDEASLVFYRPYHSESRYSADEALSALRQRGTLEGMFPQRHFLGNITRYMRFASASYGANVRSFLGIRTKPTPRAPPGEKNDERHSFAHHSRSDPKSVLLASFIDSQGGSDSTGLTNTGLPLVHYISLDHESKAVVLTCRGTLGFEDVLTDMTCEYDTLVWRDEPYRVHKGIHASARRLLYGGDGRVLVILRDALEQHPDYGIVLTGHSLGGAVTSVLAIMLAEPGQGPSSPFVTSPEPHRKLLTQRSYTTQPTQIPDHATLGLITTIVNHHDIVPYLSLGLFQDLQGVALALRTDGVEDADPARARLRQRAVRATLAELADPDNWIGGSPRVTCKAAEKAFARLKVLNGSMTAEKLVPPGNVFVAETTGCWIGRKRTGFRGRRG
ncbi:hypothetical protein N0V88_003452 [Collariella sp. IMI 366227]|nr:hypothetical protein N0V88_003452 [Collariella sp. IMI 366227]